MSVTVKIPTQLRAASGGNAQVEVTEANSVGEALTALFQLHAELKDRIANDDGTLRRFVNIYINGEDIRFLEGLDTPVSDGTELNILPAVAGGS